MCRSVFQVGIRLLVDRRIFEWVDESSYAFVVSPFEFVGAVADGCVDAVGLFAVGEEAADEVVDYINCERRDIECCVQSDAEAVVVV